MLYQIFVEWVNNQFLLRAAGNPVMFIMEVWKYFFGAFLCAWILYHKRNAFKERLRKQCPCYRLKPNGQYMENVHGKPIESTLSRAA